MQVPDTFTVIDTVLVFDTVRTVLVDSVRVTDTLGVVLQAKESVLVTGGRLLLSIATLLIGVAAAYAAWKAALASQANARAADSGARAAASQASAAELQLRAAERSVELQHEQLSMLRATQAGEHAQQLRALRALASRLRVPLADLDENGPGHRQLKNYGYLTSEDISNLEGLAREVSEEATLLATRAAIPLRYILMLIEKARPIPDGMGWVATEQERTNYRTALQNANHLLAAIARLGKEGNDDAPTAG